MSREIKKDFKNLTKFFEGYSLSSFKDNPKLQEILTQQHKKYFSYLTFIAEIEAQRGGLVNPNLSIQQVNYLTESCSDIGNSIFVMMHGAYKASRMMLRSSIETFLKGFNADDLEEIFTEKSMYVIFDHVKALDFFQKEKIMPIFISLHNDYKELCRDIHTATTSNMDNLTALEYFPSFKEKSAKSISKISIRLMSNYLVLLCLKYNKCFTNMHHRNKENILVNIPRDFKRAIHGIDL